MQILIPVKGKGGKVDRWPKDLLEDVGKRKESEVMGNFARISELRR